MFIVEPVGVSLVISCATCWWFMCVWGEGYFRFLRVSFVPVLPYSFIMISSSYTVIFPRVWSQFDVGEN